MKGLALVLDQIGLQDMRRIIRRELFFRLLRRVADSLHRHEIPGQINPVFLTELSHDPVGDPLVKIIAAKVVVARCRQNFYHTLADLYD